MNTFVFRISVPFTVPNEPPYRNENKNLPKLPEAGIGTKYFLTVRKKFDIYVDKSLLIKEILEHDRQVILITRPRRWGKSLNLDMLRAFLQVETDENRLPVAADKRVNHKFFLGGEIELDGNRRKVLQKLKIADHSDICEYQGRFPVIHVDFGRLYSLDQESVECFIHELLLFHLPRFIPYMVRSTVEQDTQLNENQKKQLVKYLQWWHSKDKFSQHQMEDCLRFLTEILYSKHNRTKVYILVDDYHYPIELAYSELEGKPTEFAKTMLLFRNMFTKAFVNNSYLERAVVTGVPRINNANFFVDSWVAEHGSVLDEEFAAYYGFTRDEIDALLKCTPTRVSPTILKSYYTGYNNAARVLQNPWSWLSCLYLDDFEPPQDYWSRTGAPMRPHIVKVLAADNSQRNVHHLMQRRPVIKHVHKWIPANDEVGECEYTMYSWLVAEGYLNAIPVSSDGADLYHLLIPNRDAGLLYVSSVEHWIWQKLTLAVLGIDVYYEVLRALVKGEMEKFCEQFKERVHSTRKLQREDDYHNLVGGTVALLCWVHGYTVWDSYSSPVLVPRPGAGNNVLVLEYRVTKAKDNLTAIASDGLNRINNKFDEAKVKDKIKEWNGIEQIIKISMAFSGKLVNIEYQSSKV